MVGGDRAEFERARPALEAMGRLIVHAGPLGHGQLVKVINNSVAAVNATVVGQALLVGGARRRRPRRAHRGDGRGLGRLGDARAQGRADAQPQLQDPVQARSHAQGRPAVPRGGPGRRAPFEFAALAREILTAASGRGLGDADFAALIEALEGQAGFQL